MLLPDWRDAGAYDYTQDLTLHQWAWEFLRRSPVYLKAWTEYRQSHPTNPIDSLLASLEASHPFYLDEPADPSLDAQEGHFSWLRYVGMQLLSTRRQGRAEGYRDGGKPEISLTFDFSMPLSPQLEMARTRLERLQEQWKAWLAEAAGVDRVRIEPRRRFQPDTFLRLIRLLDAKTQGASIGEMGRTLFPEVSDTRRSAKQALRRAEELSREGYRDLLLHSP